MQSGKRIPRIGLLCMILRRVLQFVRALFARVSTEDKAFVEKNLAPELQRFFYDLSVPDQCHALRVARNAAALAKKKPTGTVEMPLLLRCALLHDIGRKKGDLGTWWKSFAVLFAAFCPDLARSYGEDASDGILGRKMHVYFHHPQIGAEFLLQKDLGKEAEIVRKHHEAPAEDDPPELRILRMADEMH